MTDASPPLNVPLLEKTLREVEDNPEEWDQDWWRTRSSCGTTCCYAGRAATLEGAIWTDATGDYVRMEPLDIPEGVIFINGVRSIPVMYRAQRLLGLTRDEAYRLFCATNDLDDLRRIVRELIETRG